jgi:hypothetical protein
MQVRNTVHGFYYKIANKGDSMTSVPSIWDDAEIEGSATPLGASLPDGFDFSATKNTSALAEALDFENSIYAPSERDRIV